MTNSVLSQPPNTSRPLVASDMPLENTNPINKETNKPEELVENLDNTEEQETIQNLHAKDPKPKKELSMSNSNNTPIYGIPSLIDSAFRGVGRFIETHIHNYFVRIGFRYITEILRYTSSRTALSYIEQKPVDPELLKIALKKALEIAMGAAVIDPNRETNYEKRIGGGFLNMFARLGARTLMIATKLLKPHQFSLKTLVDEFVSRTLCRVLFINSKNPLVGIGCRTIEQFAINEWLRNLPMYNLVLSHFDKKK